MNFAQDQQKLKWQNDLHRREQVAKAIDFYNNQQEQYTLEYMKLIYSEKAFKKLKKYLTCDSLTKSIIDDMSIMFQNGISIQTDNEAVNEFLQEVIADTQFQHLLLKVNRLVNLTHKVAIVPFYSALNDKFSFDIITGDKCFIQQNLNFPTEADIIYYTVNPLTDSPQVSRQLNIYVRWTRETMDKVEINSEGNVTNIIESNQNPYLKYNMLPFVWFYDDLNIDTFWSECGNFLIKDNLDINRLLTNLALMAEYQTFSTLVTTGIDTPVPLYVGPQFHINLSRKSYSTSDIQPDAKYITPEAKINEVWQIICDKAVKCAKRMGLSAQAYTTRASAESYNSGYQLKLSKIDIINKNILQQPLYIQAIEKLIKVLLITSNIYKHTHFDVDNLDIRINLYKPQIELSPAEVEQVRALKISNGTWSPIRSLMEDYPDLSYEEAKELYSDIQEENRLAMAKNPFAEFNVPEE
ncbi:MAG: phage portal protein [Candidatus Cloacimonas acidaminovorans]|nr:phage portal protein [Candidatus Cloacimonas acidaminovorans]